MEPAAGGGLGSPAGMRWAGRVLVVSALCALLCAPCSGWWGRQPSGVRDLDAVQKRAAELWKAANDTDADSVEATAKAASMNATATQAEDAAAYARRGSVFGKKPAPAEEVEALDFAAKQARALADTAQQRADALSRVARQARKRAGKADEVVEASQQTVEITKKLERSNVQLLEVRIAPFSPFPTTRLSSYPSRNPSRPEGGLGSEEGMQDGSMTQTPAMSGRPTTLCRPQKPVYQMRAPRWKRRRGWRRKGVEKQKRHRRRWKLSKVKSLQLARMPPRSSSRHRRYCLQRRRSSIKSFPKLSSSR